jgi:UrcA family protein
MKLAHLALVACAFAAPAYAGEYNTPVIPTMTVSYADLDLSTRAGRDTLANRVDAKIYLVCSANAGRDFQAVFACERDTKAALIDQSQGLVRLALTRADPGEADIATR